MVERNEDEIKLEKVEVTNLIRFMIAAEKGEFKVLMTALMGDFLQGMMPKMSSRELVDKFVQAKQRKDTPTHSKKKRRTV